MYKVAIVKFVESCHDNKGRPFKLYDDAKVGDYVVCDNKYGFALGIVLEIISLERAEKEYRVPTKQIVGVCNTAGYHNRKQIQKNKEEEVERLLKKIIDENKDKIIELVMKEYRDKM